MEPTDLIPCIGGPLHGKTKPYGRAPTLRMETWGPRPQVHSYSREHYANHDRRAVFWVHPDATDAQIDHAMGLAGL